MERQTVTIKEAAAALGISKTFAYNLAAGGGLPVLRLGKKMVIPRAALNRMLENGIEATQEAK